MNTKRFFQLLSAGILVLLTACQGTGQASHDAMSAPTTEINGVRLATGAADVPPLWAFCSAAAQSAASRTFQCHASVLQTLAVGHLFLLADAALSNGGDDLTWQLSIDDYAVDLDSFGMFDAVMPAMAPSPSPIREVFTRVTDWNLVMTNLNPGQHTLRFQAQNDTESYTWLVDLAVQPADGTDVSSVPFPPKF